jgi:hypothetical protein
MICDSINTCDYRTCIVLIFVHYLKVIYISIYRLGFVFRNTVLMKPAIVIVNPGLLMESICIVVSDMICLVEY